MSRESERAGISLRQKKHRSSNDVFSLLMKRVFLCYSVENEHRFADSKIQETCSFLQGEIPAGNEPRRSIFNYL